MLQISKYQDQIPNNSDGEQDGQYEEAWPPDIFFPIFLFKIFENNNSQEETSRGSSNVGHVADLESSVL